MTFTVIFKDKSRNLSYMLGFEPCPIWRKIDDDWFINLNPETPKYQLGSIRKLIEKEDIMVNNRQAIIVIQEEGYGTYEDFDNLKRDLRQEGFKYSIVSFQE